MTGFVSIVGAGPGPADLMTLCVLDRLQHADMLALIPAAAGCVYVGRAGLTSVRGRCDGAARY
ncbi:hypothetical protein LP414_29165 [Polaromonas sp. P1(28)-13]|nr:hypothetical protein LP414_29165 [Polaromonas sp. P1(28)-13]